MSSERKGMLFCLGCISVIPGMKSQLVNSMSFHPPTIKGYKYTKGGDSVVLFDFHRKKYITLNEMKKNLINIDPGRSIIQVKFTSVNSIDMLHYINPAAKLTIIYSHSNATDIGYLFGHLLDFSHKAQVNIISYEYNGYGQSKKKTSEDSLYENIKTIVSYSINTLKLPASNLILYGQSIGSAPTVHFASNYNSIKIGGIIIHSGIKSAVSVICNNTNTKSLPWYDAFKNLEKIQKVKCPVFVIHGTADTIIPFNHGEMLYKLSPNKYTPWYVKGANHCNIELNWRGELISKVKQFIDYISPKPKINLSKSYYNRDITSISRISTLSSQEFENLYNDIDNYNEDDNEDVYCDYSEYDIGNQTSYYFNEEFSCIKESYTKNYPTYHNNTKSSSKYFNNEISQKEKIITREKMSQSKTCTNNHYIQTLNENSYKPENKYTSNQVVYGVSIYEDNINLIKGMHSNNH